MAIIKACSSGTAAKNTGKECDVMMGATAMLLMVPPQLRFSLAQVKDPLAWITPLLHAAPQQRVYPLFGAAAPIKTITNNTESDVIVTLDDGSQHFLRYGMYNRMLATTSGGLCYAQSLQSFLNAGYVPLEIDQQGQMLAHQYDVDSYGGVLADFMYSPSPQLANLKDAVYMNRFQYTYNPIELVSNCKVLKGAGPLLSQMGLIDARVKQALPATTTKLKISVLTDCAELDLIALFPTQLPLVSNFIVTDAADGSVVVPTAAAIVAGNIELTGTYVTGHKYNVVGSAPSVLLGNQVIGYDINISATITIP